MAETFSLDGAGEMTVPASAARIDLAAKALVTISPMAYDEHLADRIRELLVENAGVAEKNMFGGLAFLIGGHMAVSASGQGGLMVRVDPEASDKFVETSNVRLVEMRGRPMRGWLRIDAEDVRTKRQLAKWVNLGATYARSLPAKP